MNIKKPQYDESILAVVQSILRYYNAPHDYSTLKELDQFLQSQPRHIILVLLDGLGVNLINEHLNDTDAIKKHMKRAITSVFPPTTVAATNAVLSGNPPIVNGHIGWVQYYKAENVNSVVFQNKDFYTNAEFSEDLRQKYFSYDTILEQIKRVNSDIQIREFFPSFVEGGAASFEEEVERVLLFTHHCDQSFSYVYWTEPDITQHETGIHSHQTKAMVQSLNETFTELLQNITDDTAVILIADHGLIDVTPIKLYEQKDLISCLSQQPSIEPRTTTFFVQQEKRDFFQKRFNELYREYFILYKTEDFLETKLLGEGMMHEHLDQCLGDFIAVAIDKYMFVLNEGKVHLAHHAGLTEGEMMVPLVLYKK
jgi:predicted AlkP superfamily pyrophosphatase or phosphodiesterase